MILFFGIKMDFKWTEHFQMQTYIKHEYMGWQNIGSCKQLHYHIVTSAQLFRNLSRDGASIKTPISQQPGHS